MTCAFLASTIGHLRRAAAAISLLAVSGIALAQDNTAAPQPGLHKSPAPWIGLLVIFIMLVIVVSISLMPSKRSHQD